MPVRSRPAFSVVRQRGYSLGFGLLAYVAIVCGLCAIQPAAFGAAATQLGSSLGRFDGVFSSTMLLTELSLISYDLIGWRLHFTGRTAELRQVNMYAGDMIPLDTPLGPVGKVFVYVFLTVLTSIFVYLAAFVP